MPININNQETSSGSGNTSVSSGVDITTLFSYTEVTSLDRAVTKFVVYENTTPKTIKVGNLCFWGNKSSGLRSGVTSAIEYSSGDVYIGNPSNGNNNLYVNNDIGCKGTLTVLLSTIPSDIRLKEDIKPIDNALEKVNQIKGYYYKYKNKDIPLIGVIAQEVQKVIPEAVITNSEGELSVMYGNLVGLLINAINELHSEVEKLK